MKEMRTMGENERIAKVEVQLTNVVTTMERIEKLLLRNQEEMLPRKEAELRFNKVSKEIEEIKQDKKQERSAKEARWVSWCALAVTVVLGYLNYMK
jgi:putative hemolysin